MICQSATFGQSPRVCESAIVGDSATFGSSASACESANLPGSARVPWQPICQGLRECHGGQCATVGIAFSFSHSLLQITSLNGHDEAISGKTHPVPCHQRRGRRINLSFEADETRISWALRCRHLFCRDGRVRISQGPVRWARKCINSGFDCGS
jgi:hypothetical protein